VRQGVHVGVVGQLGVEGELTHRSG
jgi:hypothetical protein